ncbi:MAG: uracil-xanthine permease [Clostridiaceae bacterium]|nr:uracil-xanthine permease [Clostridiaceae bacterium]
MMKKDILENRGIYDAMELGLPKMILLGIQHTFAMFGATVLVPLLTGLDVGTTLLMAGLGTLLFHFLTRGRIPAFLGSSFAFLGGYQMVAPMLDGRPNTEMLPYACGGVVCAGLLYLVMAALMKFFGSEKVMRFFPPVVTGPIIISIGLILAPSAISNCATNWPLALIALAAVLVFNLWGRGIIRLVPILLAILVSYAAAVLMHAVDFTAVREARLIGIAIHPASFAKFDLSAVITIMPIALATMMEHIGDICAISATTGVNYVENPGFHRTMLGDGLATSLSAMFGGPANTTYGENTGVLALTGVYDPRVVRFAAYFAILLSFCPKFAAIIQTVPSAIIGGISFVLYGMISAVGLRNLVESKVDFSRSRNLLIAAVILVSAFGFNSIDGISFTLAGTPVKLSGLAIAAIAGITLNAVLPLRDTAGEHETGN